MEEKIKALVNIMLDNNKTEEEKDEAYKEAFLLVNKEEYVEV